MTVRKFAYLPKPAPAITFTMEEPSSPRQAWPALWLVALASLFVQLWLCQFFTFGQRVPVSIDVDPCNLWKYAYQWPPQGEFLVLNWLGLPNLPPPLNPFSLGGALLSPWFFFTTYTPVMSTLALVAMAGFLRELELPRPAALFGAVVFAWQGDILSFVFPGHFGYIATWFFYALAAWGALRSNRTSYWAYPLISGASCGVMVGLQPDRGGIASLLIAALYLAPILKSRAVWLKSVGNLALCVVVAVLISAAGFLALFQSYVVGVSMGGENDPEQVYKFDTQFSLGPEETLTYLAPGLFGWHSDSITGPYWGRVGQWPGWEEKHEGMRNFDLAISTIGTIPSVLALLAALALLPGRAGNWMAMRGWSERQLLYGRLLLVLGAIALILGWGYHTPLYRLVYALPLMDKWRNPLKWLEITNFAACTLTAYGVCYLKELIFAPDAPDIDAAAVAKKRSPLRVLFIALFVFLCVLLFGSLIGSPQLMLNLQDAGYNAQAIPIILGTLHESLFFAVVFMGLFCVLVWCSWHPDRLRGWHLENPLLNRLWENALQPQYVPGTLTAALGLLSVLHLGWVHTQFLRPADLSTLTQDDPLVEALKSEGNTVRVSVDAQDPVLNLLLQNQFVIPEISCLEISAASRIPDNFNAFLHNFDDDQVRLWQLAGVKNRVVGQQSFAELQKDPKLKAYIDHVDGYMLMPTGNPNTPSHALIALKDYLAKATFVPGAEIVPTDEAQLERMRDPGWNPRATVLLDAPAAATVEPLPVKGSPGISLTTYDSHEIDVAVETPRAGYVLINDAYDPDWQVEVNDQPAPLLRADFLMRAVAVPAGASMISMRYEARYRVGGLDLSVQATNQFCDAVMLATWAVAGVALWRRRPPRPKRRPTSGPID